ncbi:hypothetical protein [Amycolatopsis sp. NPDC051102]|uniref:hypothetical protein n=1 Tax=Amycolatopsis sp. NPDC051102 TaxID=3155163 RepID=UPI00344948C2
MTTTSTDQAPLRLAIELGVEPDTIRLRASGTLAADLRPALTEAGLVNHRGFEFSSGPALELVVVTVTSPWFWGALAATIRTVVHRHDKKELRTWINDQEVAIKGYSPDDLQKIIQVLLQEEQAKRTADLERIKKLRRKDK